MVAISTSSSLDTSETSSTSPSVTCSQRSLHAREWKAWNDTNAILRSSHDADLQKRGSRIAACCCCPVFCVGTNASLKLSPGFCRDRLCPTCAHRRSRRTFHQLCRHVATMDSPRFITFTQTAKREHLFLSLARLRGNLKMIRRSPVWTSSVRGGVYCIEVTRNATTGLWHVHVHLIVDGDFIAQKRLSDAWRAASGDSYIVDIRAVHSKAQVASYVTKYVSKPTALTSWPAAAVEEFARDMAGVRTVHAFGNQHNREIEPGDDGCIVQRVEPLCTSTTILRRLRQGCTHAANAVHLINRMGGTFRRALGLSQPPDDDQPLPLLPDEHEELIGHLRSIMQHQEVDEIPRSVWRLADLRIDECPWS